MVATRAQRARGQVSNHEVSNTAGTAVTMAMQSPKSFVVTPDVECSTRTRFSSTEVPTREPRALRLSLSDEDVGDNDHDDGDAVGSGMLLEAALSGDTKASKDEINANKASPKSSKRRRSTDQDTAKHGPVVRDESSGLSTLKAETVTPTTRRGRRRSSASSSTTSSAAALSTSSEADRTDTETESVPKEERKRKRNRTAKKSEEEGKPRDPPGDWEKIYRLVEELRADKTAPVDTDGGYALPERQHGEVVFRFQLLIALMLSSQTKDAVVGDTMRALQKYGLTVGKIHQTSAEDLDQMIRSVGFHNNKTKFIKQACQIILQDYGGDIPPTAEELMKLPGVGPKMAYIVEAEAFGVARGIGVDTHMHRIFNDLGWVTNTKTPEKTRLELESWLPRELWRSVNVLWVGFGQETQQQKEKILRKALDCSQPGEALALIQKVGRFDLTKEAKKIGLEEKVKLVLEGGVTAAATSEATATNSDESMKNQPLASAEE